GGEGPDGDGRGPIPTDPVLLHGQATRGDLAAEGRRLSDAGRLAGQARAGRSPSRRRPARHSRQHPVGPGHAPGPPGAGVPPLPPTGDRIQPVRAAAGTARALGVGRDRSVLPGWDVVDTDPDGVASVTSANLPAAGDGAESLVSLPVLPLKGTVL